MWDTLRNANSDILEKQEFQGIKLLLPSEKGRVTRRGTRIGCDESAYRKLFEQKLIVYGNYLHNLSEQFVFRFHPWPQWLILCNEAFNFEISDVSTETRKDSFEQLMECPFGPNPLLDNEKARLRSEYVTFLLNASNALDILKQGKPNFTDRQTCGIYF